MVKQLPRFSSVLLVSFFLVVQAGASADPAVRHRPAGESDLAARKWWTPERMAGAREKLPVAAGAPVADDPSLDPAGAAIPDQALVPAGLRGRVARDADPAIGRLFFRWRGRAYSCSGTVIDTPRQRLVLTAGHCLKDAGHWSSYVRFVPAYHRGQRPYGTWGWQTLFVTRHWARTRNLFMTNFDIGVIVTRLSRRHRRIGDVTGSLPYAYFPDRTGLTRIYGYPGGANGGRDVKVCLNRRTWDGPRYSYLLPGPVGMAAWCDLARGSSGGPWLSAYDDGYGGTDWLVDGLTSTGWRGRLGSPYFGREFRTVLHKAEHDRH